MSAVAVAVVLLILAAGVIWGCVVDYLRGLDERKAHDYEERRRERDYARERRRY